MTRVPKRGTPGAPRIPAWTVAALLGLLATLVAAWLCQHVFEGIPHFSDGVAYAFQARVFASGHLWLAPPPVPEAFGIGNVVLNESRWAGKYPPGWPLLLSVGYLLNAPGLVNPVLLGLAVFGLFRLGRTLYDEPTGLLGALLLAISPFALIYGATFLSHVPALCVTIWTFDALARGKKSDDPRPLLLAGLLAGLAATVRPYTAAALIFPAGIWLVWRTPPRVALRRTALVVAGAALPLLLNAGFNAALWGHPLRTGYNEGGFSDGLTGTPGRYRSPFALLREHLPRYLVDLNLDPWAEPWPDLLPLLFLLPRRRRRAGDGLLLASSLALVVAHSLYWHYDPIHAGPRYALEALGPLSLLVARGLRTGAALLKERLAGLRRARIIEAALILPLAALLFWFPLGRRLPELMVSNSRAYGGQTLEPLRRPGAERVGPDALILVSSNLPGPTYNALALLNEVDPRNGRRVYALDVGARREKLSAAYPREEVWSVAVELAPWPREGRFDEPSFEVRRALWRRVR